MESEPFVNIMDTSSNFDVNETPMADPQQSNHLSSGINQSVIIPELEHIDTCNSDGDFSNFDTGSLFATDQTQKVKPEKKKYSELKTSYK